jgi:hypothetical protein
MREPFFKGIPWGRFMEFISPDADRPAIITELLREDGLEFKIIEIAGNRHIVIAPHPPEEKYLRRPPTMLVAHYDRAEGSPGANDNSSGVFILLETASKLKKGGAHNWIIIFTDKEELKPSEGIQAQGAYALAIGLKSLKIENHKIFSFDACGTGDTLIISTTLEYLLKKEGGGEKLRESTMELRNIALDTARNLGMKKVLLSPTPFSDDVGFFRAGLAAQTITMLPSEECIRLVSALRKNPDYADALINQEQRKNNRLQFIPDTWRGLNTPTDSYLRLTPPHFRTVARFAEALCRG